MAIQKQEKKVKGPGTIVLGWVLLIVGIGFLFVFAGVRLNYYFSPSTPEKVSLGDYFLCASIPLLIMGLGIGLAGFLVLRPFKCRIGSHQWQVWRTVTNFTSAFPAQCEEERSCDRCGARETRHEQPHLWSEWNYLANSCTLERVCSRCQVRETKPESHAWGEWSYPPNFCKEQRVCSRCKIRETKPDSHTWGEWIYPPNSCKQERVCSRCKIRETRPETHTWGEWLEDSLSCESKRICQRCGKIATSPNHQWVVESKTFIENKYSSWAGEDINVYHWVYKCEKCGEINETNEPD